MTEIATQPTVETAPIEDSSQLRELAAQLRVDSIRMTTAAGSGHPTSSMSAAELMAVLLGRYLRYDFNHPHDQRNDRLIFSKGHAAPLLYAMYRAAGAITDEEMMTLRQFGSRMQGHPNPRVLPYVDVATGSLGQGLAIGVGMALAGSRLDRLPFNVWVLLGDSEMAEGSVWEAVDKAGHYELDNIVALLDMNRLGQRGPTELEWNGGAYAARLRAFGWHTIEVDGHDVDAVDGAYREALATRGRPTCVIARTEKGHGASLVANKEGWHGKALDAEQAAAAIEELGGERNLVVRVQSPEPFEPAPVAPVMPPSMPVYEVGKKEATRRAFGDALVALGASRGDVVVLDGEVGNSTYTEAFAKKFPERFFEMWIAEQQMIGAGVGLAVLGRVAFAATFAAFLTRAYDQIRMAAISGISLRLCGSHAGVSIGEDGPSQMGLEDIAMMRAVVDSTVLYPSDANQAANLVGAMAERPGIVYMRTTRMKTPIIYQPAESFPIGGSCVLRESAEDRVTVIGAGVTLHEALAAHEKLAAEGIAIRVIDLYSVKPIDRNTLHRAADDTAGGFVVVEDHWEEGGLGDAVLDAFTGADTRPPRTIKLAVRETAGSGPPEALLAAAGIDAEHIVTAVKSLL